MLRNASQVRRAFSTCPISLKPSLQSSTSSVNPQFLRKGEGTIASVFATLSGGSLEDALPSRFADLKRSMIRDEAHATAIKSAWTSVLKSLNSELSHIIENGENSIPQVQYPGDEFAKKGLEHWMDSKTLDEIKKRGTVIVKGVVEEAKALKWKEQIRDYVRANPKVKGFPSDSPQVFEMYWSPSQIEARSNPALLQTSQAFLKLFHTPSQTESSAFKDNLAPNSLAISLSNPLNYADRLRIRHPGDSKFALGCHIDGGGVERWECPSFQSVWKSILKGDSEWKKHDAWSLGASAERLRAQGDMYDGPGQCRIFRPLQGWLSMSNTGAGEGTLRVLPNLKEATAYIILRPFFKPKSKIGAPTMGQPPSAEYLALGNWEFDCSSASFPGCSLGHNIELSTLTHPHLDLERSMTSIPRVAPGDMALWHCDVVHSVESQHRGQGDSSVMYIPAIPLTEHNFNYVLSQRESFKNGTPPSDFPGGEGESDFVGRARPAAVPVGMARRSMGLQKFEIKNGMSEAERNLLEACNDQI